MLRICRPTAGRGNRKAPVWRRISRTRNCHGHVLTLRHIQTTVAETKEVSIVWTQGHRLAALLVLALLVFVSTGASSAEPEDLNLAVRVQGTIGKGGSLRLAVETGSVATRSLMVFSEPSHTLLLLIVDEVFATTDVGRDWLAGLRTSTKPVVTVTTTLPNGEPLVEIKGRPASDDRIVVWALGRDGTGKPTEMLVADAQVGNRGFGFSTFVERGTDALYRHCCDSEVCGKNCVECGSPKFTCCLNAPPMECCWIGCNHVQCPC